MPKTPKPQLSREEALSIASDAAKGTAFANLMSMTTIEEHDGRLRWIVGSATTGSGFEVVIDDATGQAVSTRFVGVR